jgi:uncharacterized membrane protein YkgB
MKQLCKYCNKETKGIKMVINKEPLFFCYECKNKSKYIPYIHPNYNEKYASIISLDFEGSHNSEYGK